MADFIMILEWSSNYADKLSPQSPAMEMGCRGVCRNVRILTHTPGERTCRPTRTHTHTLARSDANSLMEKTDGALMKINFQGVQYISED